MTTRPTHCALIAERERRLTRLRGTDFGRSQPALEDLAVDPRWTLPALAASPIHAVLVRVPPLRLEQVRAAFARVGRYRVLAVA